MRPEKLGLSRNQSVQRIHGTGPGEKRVSDLEGDPLLVLVLAERIAVDKIVVEKIDVAKVVVEGVAVEGIAFERVVVDRVFVDRVPVERVPVERVASCHPIHEHRKDSACHLGVDPPQPLDECWDRLDWGTLHFR